MTNATDPLFPKKMFSDVLENVINSILVQASRHMVYSDFSLHAHLKFTYAGKSCNETLPSQTWKAFLIQALILNSSIDFGFTLKRRKFLGTHYLWINSPFLYMPPRCKTLKRPCCRLLVHCCLHECGDLLKRRGKLIVLGP